MRETIDGLKINKLHDTDVWKDLIQYDIVFLQETHADDTSDIALPGFAPAINHNRRRRGKTHKSSGGISVIMKKELREVTKCLPQSNSDIVWLCTKTSTGPLYIGSVYIPPENSTYGRDHTANIWDRLQTDLEQLTTRGDVLVCGDFNARTGTVTDYIAHDSDSNHYPLPDNYNCELTSKRTSMDNTVNKYGRKLASICLDNNMHILNGRTLGDLRGKYTCHTAQGSSIVDYFLCSQHISPDIITMTVNDLTPLSDHCPIDLNIYVTFNQNPVTPKPETEGIDDRHHKQKSPKVKRFNWDENSADSYTRALESQEIQNLLKETMTHDNTTTAAHTADSIDSIARGISDVLMRAAEISLTQKPTGNKDKRRQHANNKKWFDSDCRVLRKDLKSLLNAINRNPQNKTIKAKYFSKRKEYNKLVKRRKREAKQKLVETLNEAADRDPNALWSAVRELKDMEKPKTDSARTINGSKWAGHLENILSRETTADKNRQQTIKSQLARAEDVKNFNSMDFPITNKEITLAARNLKHKKAPGIDGVSNEMIKTSIPDIIDTLRTSFNAILSSGHFPTTWKTGVSSPIYKGGDPTDPGNYRGITLTSTLAKLFCQIINARVVNYLEDRKLYAPEQAGFRKNFRTTDHVYVLKSLVDKHLKSKTDRLYCCFVDLQKAFDTVWHDAMLLKLQKIGVNGLCYKVIKSMYTNSIVTTKTTDGLAHTVEQNRGVQQGNNLSPTLFNIFINDLPKHLNGHDSPLADSATGREVPCLLYADDLALLSTTKAGMQKKLDKLNQYCSDWGLSINKRKTKIVIFSRTPPKIQINFKLGHDIIETVDTYKYLGVIFHSSGNFSTASEHLAKQANKASHALRRAIYKQEINPALVLQLFDSLVYPVATYGAEVWFPFITNLPPHPTDLQRFYDDCLKGQWAHEGLHMKFLKSVLGVNKKAMNLPTLSELGRFPLSIKVLTQTIGFWSHIVESDDNTYLKQLYNEQIHTLDTPWILNVKRLLSALGMEHVWQNQTTLSASRLKTAVQRKLEEGYVKYWETKKMENISKLAFYSSLDIKYTMQPYVTATRPPRHRSALAKLRISAHVLEIERGRYKGVPRGQRLCTACNTLEDESHFLDSCKRYTQLRTDLLQQTDNKHKAPSDMLNDEDSQTALAKYVYNCFMIRDKGGGEGTS